MRLVGLLLCLILSAHAQARSSAKCMAAFDDSGRWSRERRVDVEFYSTRELFPDEPRHFPVIVRIWFDERDDGPIEVALDGPGLTTPQFQDSKLDQMFRQGDSAYGRERPPYDMRWRVRCVVNGQWVDPRYPEAFDPPFVPPNRRFRVQ